MNPYAVHAIRRSVDESRLVVYCPFCPRRTTRRATTHGFPEDHVLTPRQQYVPLDQWPCASSAGGRTYDGVMIYVTPASLDLWDKK